MYYGFQINLEANAISVRD